MAQASADSSSRRKTLETADAVVTSRAVLPNDMKRWMYSCNLQVEKANPKVSTPLPSKLGAGPRTTRPFVGAPTVASRVGGRYVSPRQLPPCRRLAQKKILRVTINANTSRYNLQKDRAEQKSVCRQLGVQQTGGQS